jgi:hypothetical protein
MKINLILGISLSVLVSNLNAANIDMPWNEKTCKIVDGWTNPVLEKMASQIGVPPKSMKFEGTIYKTARGCELMFSTPIGVFACSGGAFKSDDGGKTAFITDFGRCQKS